MVLKGGARFWLNEKEFGAIKALLNSPGQNFFEIQGSVIMKDAVLYIISPADIETADRIKRGEWQCEKGHWNDKGQKKCSECYF